MKLSELSLKEAVMEAARMYVQTTCWFVASCTYDYFSIYLVHDDAKEKEFELEMSWIGSESNNLHVPVPKDLFNEAEAQAKAALENFE